MAGKKPPEEVAPEQQLKYQTWVLKVSIHCEGCRKKVKKVLQAIHGVYETEVDPKQHKVTVTGNVEADTLLKKLTRSGKQAELWPLLELNNDKKTANNTNKESPQLQASTDDHRKEDNDDDEEEDDHDQKNPGQAVIGEKATVGGGNGGGGGGGNGGKKKKKKKKKVGQSPNGESGGGGDGGPANNAGLAPLVLGIDSAAVNQGLPIHHVFHPPVYNEVYGSNNSTAYHSTSDSYYAHKYPGQQARHVVHSYGERYGAPANPINIADDVYYDNVMESGCSIM